MTEDSLNSSHARLAQRLEQIKPFYAMDILAKANQLQQQGKDIIHLEVGEPDFDMPAPIQRAALHAVQQGSSHYTAALGLPALRQAIAADYQAQGLANISADNIAVTTGSSAALMMSLSSVCDPTHSVLLTDPGYPCNKHFVSLLQAKPEFIRLSPQQGFRLSLADVKQHWHHAIKALLLASPANPTGACIAHDELCAIAQFVEQQGAFLILDEIYRGLQYSEAGSSLAGFNANTLIINSFSKFYGMTGWRVGWMVAAPDIIQAVDVLAQNVYLAPPTISQHAALAAFDPETLLQCQQRRDEFQQRRDFLVARLRDLGFGVEHMPEGAFYVYARLPQGFHDSMAFCRDLLDQSGVAITPGADFSVFDAAHYVRFAYTAELSRLQLGMEKLAAFLQH